MKADPLRFASLLKKTLQYKCFPVIFAVSKNTFFVENLRTVASFVVILVQYLT